MTLGNAYANVIENYTTNEIRPIFDQKIDPSAKVKTDKWSSYKSISKDFNIEQVK